MCCMLSRLMICLCYYLADYCYLMNGGAGSADVVMEASARVTAVERQQDGCCVCCCKRCRSCRFCTFIQIHTWFLLQPLHFHPVFPNPFPLADDPSPLEDLHFYLLYIWNLSENSGLLPGDEIIDTMLFTCEQTFDKCHFIPVEFSLASTWWDSYPKKRIQRYQRAPDEINRYAARNIRFLLHRWR